MVYTGKLLTVRGHANILRLHLSCATAGAGCDRINDQGVGQEEHVERSWQLHSAAGLALPLEGQ